MNKSAPIGVYGIETMVKRSLILMVLVLWAATVAAAQAPQPDPTAERVLFNLLNQERAKAGVPRLQWDENLAAAARRHAIEMAKRHTLSHDFPGEPSLRDRIAATGMHFDRVGENVAFGDNAADIHQTLVASPPHRANILSPEYNAGGIGAFRIGNELYAAQDFAHRVAEYSSNEAESVAAEAIRNLSPKLVREDAPILGERACSMADQDTLSAKRAANGLTGVRQVFAFTASDPGNLPGDLRQALAEHSATAFSVGACYARSKTYAGGMYWVLVTLYGSRRPPRVPADRP